jgi:hypothetical protein
MPEWYVFAEDEILPERPFTHPNGTQRDFAAMQYTLALLRQALRSPHQLSNQVEHQQICFVAAQGRQHRLIVNRAPAMLAQTAFVLVGFYGNRRREADPVPIDQTDHALVEEMSQQPGLLAYCTTLFPDETYGNTILFVDHAAKEHWSNSHTHRYAVEVLSPAYYHHVRLHSGWLTGPLLANTTGVLQITKYYDFASASVWLGLRSLSHWKSAEVTPDLYPYTWQPIS